MDITFSPTLSSFPIPTRREFLASPSHLSLPVLLHSRRRCRRQHMQLSPPRCTVQGPAVEYSAYAVVLIAALHVAYVEYAKRLRGHISEQGITKFLTVFEQYNQDSEITEQDVRLCSSERFYTEPYLLKESTTVERVKNYLSSEKVDSSRTMDGNNRLRSSSLDTLYDKSGTGALSSPSAIVPAVGVAIKDNIAVKMPNILLWEPEEPVPVSNSPENQLGHSFFSSIPVKKKREIHQNSGLEHIATKDDDFLASGYDSLREVSSYRKETQPDLRSITCFNSFSSEGLILSQHENIGSYTPSPDPKSIQKSEDL